MDILEIRAAPDGTDYSELPATRSEAKSLGVKYYFTSKPCSSGHFSVRSVGAGRCLECSRQRDANRREHKEDMRKIWRSKNKEKRNATEQAWRDKNRDKVREGQRRAYYRDHQASKAKAHAAYVKDADGYKVRAAKRRAIKNNADGNHSKKDLEDIRARQKDKCACCGIRLAGKGHADHIIPISKGGSDWPKNIQYLCAPCNISKRDKDPVDFMKSRGFLL